MIITGAAPTSPTVLGFLRAALGCQVRPIKCALISLTSPCDMRIGLNLNPNHNFTTVKFFAVSNFTDFDSQANIYICFNITCFCVQVYEAYGQTECTAGCTFTTPGDWTQGRRQWLCKHVEDRSQDRCILICLWSTEPVYVTQFKGFKVLKMGYDFKEWPTTINLNRSLITSLSQLLGTVKKLKTLWVSMQFWADVMA